MALRRITPFLWFDSEAEAAARFYTGVFNDSKIVSVTHYSAEVAAAAGRPEGSVMTVAFELEGQPFVALNGGPVFHFSEAISFVIDCASQEEIDHFWNSLSAGGDPRAQQCGWLKDRFGLSWQVVPSMLPELLADPDPERGRRALKAMLGMKKLDIAELRRAADRAD